MWQFVLILAVIYFFFRWKAAELQAPKKEPRVHPENKKSGNGHQDNEEDYTDYEEIK